MAAGSSELGVAGLRRLRRAALLLDGPSSAARRSPDEIVTWFGAMQAQDLASGHWSFGVRNLTLTDADVQRATEDRRILRTWPMRGTVHFVPPADARWMLELVGVRALAGAPRRREHLGLDEATVDRAAAVLGEALTGGGRMTRAECVDALVRAGIGAAREHAYHFLWYAAQIGVTCIGPQQGKEQTFVLLDEWVPRPNRPDRDEALALLATRFVQSHGPVRVQDLVGWTGLTTGDVRRGISVAGAAIATVSVDGSPMLVSPELLDRASAILDRDEDDLGDVLLLPGFDELVLGYKDRSAILEPGDLRDVVPGGNGVFRPTIVHRGRVVGTWQRTTRARRIDVVLQPLSRLGALDPAIVEGARRAAASYARFLGTELGACAVGDAR